MYFAATRRMQRDEDLQIYSNYLYAVAEWYVGKSWEPLEITARKVRSHYNEESFLWRLRRILYSKFRHVYCQTPVPSPDAVLKDNPTLRAVKKLCETQHGERRRIRSVITLNFDNLLEMVLSPSCGARPVWKGLSGVAYSKQLPIFHVHGYVPLDGEGSTGNELVFTEDRYHEETHNPFAWANLIQMNALSSTTVLMIGLSLTDPNMRRLLDASNRLPDRRRHFAILKEPDFPVPEPHEVSEIHERALKEERRFRRDGAGKLDDPVEELDAIITQVKAMDRVLQQKVLGSMGVEPIWINDFDEIPALVDRIL